MYASYFGLFFKFLVDRFIVGPRRKALEAQLAKKLE